MKTMTTKLLALLAAAMLIFPSCDNSNGDEPTPEQKFELTLDRDQVTFTAEGGISKVYITTDARGWNVVNGLSWLEVDRWEDCISLTAKPYTGSESRYGDVLIYVGEGASRVEKIVKVEQLGKENSSTGGGVAFECPVFQSLVLEYCDMNGDGAVSDEEAALVTEMSLTWDVAMEREPITSIKGIERFVNLVNFECDNNQITELDLSGLAKLEYVDCSYNAIKTVNLSGCKSLKQFYGNMNDIEYINLNDCDGIQLFQAWQNNITTLDMSGMKELVYLDLRINDLREVEFHDCPKLVVAAIGSNDLVSLNLSGLPELYTLGCYENNIATLDVSVLPKLEMLECYDNNISSLDLSANASLATLVCSNNLLTELKLHESAPLNKLDCGNNRLSGTLDVSAYKGLKYLHCGANAFESVVVEGCAKITDLACENTNITELKVSSLTLLESLVANHCQLTSLDCSNNLKLSKLHLQGNPLTELILAEGQYISDLKVDNHDIIVRK